jgi:DNA-binding FrmR family transcriptional regulator
MIRAKVLATRTGPPDDQVEVRVRLRRVAGQVLGIERMIADGRPCADVLMQIAAAEAALRAAGQQVYAEHVYAAAAAAARGARTPDDAANEIVHLAGLFAHAAPAAADRPIHISSEVRYGHHDRNHEGHAGHRRDRAGGAGRPGRREGVPARAVEPSAAGAARRRSVPVPGRGGRPGRRERLR